MLLRLQSFSSIIIKGGVTLTISHAADRWCSLVFDDVWQLKHLQCPSYDEHKTVFGRIRQRFERIWRHLTSSAKTRIPDFRRFPRKPTSLTLSGRCCPRMKQPTVVCHVSVVTVDFQATFKDLNYVSLLVVVGLNVNISECVW